MRLSSVAWVAALFVFGAIVGSALGQDDEVSRLTGPSLRTLQLHRGHFIETPDGVFWDMWGEQEYLKVFNRVVKKRAIKEKRTSPILAEWVTVGYRWEIEDHRDAVAWGVSGDEDDPREWYWERSVDGTPPLWHTVSPSRLGFIYIDERNRNAVAADEDTRSTKVVADLGGGLEPIPYPQDSTSPQRHRDHRGGKTSSFSLCPLCLCGESWVWG
ncbi:MAG TPA: hypothetical protein PLU35_01000 [Phycisphaerales bacterium]|nr:hypothetical protein [Phycisphaerales bacterium]